MGKKQWKFTALLSGGSGTKVNDVTIALVDEGSVKV